MSRTHCNKISYCLLWAISPFVTMFSNVVGCKGVRNRLWTKKQFGWIYLCTCIRRLKIDSLLEQDDLTNSIWVTCGIVSYHAVDALTLGLNIPPKKMLHRIWDLIDENMFARSILLNSLCFIIWAVLRENKHYGLCVMYRPD